MNKRQKNRILKWSIMLILTIFYISASDDENILKRVHAYSSEIYTSGDWKYQLNEKGQVIITQYTGSETELTIQQIDGKDVIAIGELAFQCNHVLERVTLGEGIQRIEKHAFSNCENLQEINLPDSLTFIDEYTFELCYSLKQITLPKNLQNIDGKIFGYVRPDKVDLSEENPYFVKDNGIIFDANFTTVLFSSKNELLENVILPETVTQIGDYAFADCYQVKHIPLPKSLKSIGTSAFDGCVNIEEIQLPEGVEFLGEYAFKGLTIEEITIPKSVIEVGTGVF